VKLLKEENQEKIKLLEEEHKREVELMEAENKRNIERFKDSNERKRELFRRQILRVFILVLYVLVMTGVYWKENWTLISLCVPIAFIEKLLLNDAFASRLWARILAAMKPSNDDEKKTRR